MVNNEETPLGQGYEEIIRDDSLDNTNQQLNRHVYSRSGRIDHEITDFILKRADYTNTFIAIDTAGLPNNATLYLVDENSNQLYSPVDANGNWVTTRCSITVGENDIIPLPAQFTANLASHIPFPAGTYNWKLQYPEDDYFLGEEIPLEVEIRDFKIWDILTPQIYPNGDIKIKLKTYGDTLYPVLTGSVHDLAYVLTSNATFDVGTGIITYPNQDIGDLSIGKHMQVINQSNNCFIDYEVKNPFEIRLVNTPREYSTNNQTILLASFQTVYRESDNRYVNAVETYPDIYINGSSLSALTNLGHSQGNGKIYTGTNFPPGTYNIEATAKYLPNHLYYTATKTMIVTTDNCALQLINNNFKVDLSIPKLSAGQGTGTLTINLYDAYDTSQNIESSVIDICGPNYYYERILGSELQNNSITKTLDAGEYFVIIPNCNIPLDKILQDDSVYKQKVTVSNNDTTNCNLYLHYESGNVTLTSKYLFNQSTVIPNAKMGLLKNGTLVQTGTTDSNGEVTWNITSYGSYQSVAIDDYDNSYLLYSNYESVTTYNSRISLETDADYYIIDEETIQLTGKLVKDDNTPLPLKEIIIDDNGMALKDIIKFNINSTIIYVDDETIEGHITNISDSENVNEKEIIIEVNNDTV